MLKNTPIHGTLQPPGTPQKYLFDFIDSSSVDDLEASLRACIDRTNEADSALAETIEGFGASLARLDDALDSCPPAPDSSPSPLPSSFHQLEGHATETAGLLQSLVRHYDVCVTALKHTEGGNEAATRATFEESPLPSATDLPHDLDPNLHVNLDQLDIDVASLRPDAPPPPPMTEAERADMLAVLANDAAEVDDVVAEIRDRVSDMEGLAGDMAGHIEALQTSYSGHLNAFRVMVDVGKEVPEHLASCRTFQARWGDEKTKIEEGMLALEGLREFYDGFLDAYDGLLVEVGRRRQVRIKMEVIAREALRKIERLYDGMFPAHRGSQSRQHHQPARHPEQGDRQKENNSGLTCNKQTTSHHVIPSTLLRASICRRTSGPALSTHRLGMRSWCHPTAIWRHLPPRPVSSGAGGTTASKRSSGASRTSASRRFRTT